MTPLRPEKESDHHVRCTHRPTRARKPGAIRVRLARHRCRGRDRAAGHQRGRRAGHLRPEVRARVDAEDASQGLPALRSQAHAHVGADLSEIDFDNIKYFVRSTEKQAQSWRTSRGDPQHLREARHPRGRTSASGRRCRRAVRVRGGLPPDPGRPGAAGCHLHGHRHGAARAPGVLRGVLRHGHPGRRQQVRGAEHGRVVGRLLRLRPQGRARRDPAAGVLPHQHREHGPVRADPHHRGRRQLRALHRGLHGADLQERLAPLGRGRDHREEERARALHDDPELVEQRLQPRHQARRGARGRDDGVGRRQHRLQGDDEVPSIYLMGEHAKARRSRSPSRVPVSTRTPARR